GRAAPVHPRAGALLQRQVARRGTARVPRGGPGPPRRPLRVKRAAIIGTGLIGGSVGLALRRTGTVVRGLDRAAGRVDAGARVVTDVGSAKGAVVTEVHAARPQDAPRFVGGHPMAGSEQDGLDGADADLFVGATWVLTPTDRTDPAAFQSVRALVRSLGAEVLAVTPDDHDALVAMVSHVPQL